MKFVKKFKAELTALEWRKKFHCQYLTQTPDRELMWV